MRILLPHLILCIHLFAIVHCVCLFGNECAAEEKERDVANNEECIDCYIHINACGMAKGSGKREKEKEREREQKKETRRT